MQGRDENAINEMRSKKFALASNKAKLKNDKVRDDWENINKEEEERKTYDESGTLLSIYLEGCLPKSVFNNEKRLAGHP